MTSAVEAWRSFSARSDSWRGTVLLSGEALEKLAMLVEDIAVLSLNVEQSDSVSDLAYLAAAGQSLSDEVRRLILENRHGI